MSVQDIQEAFRAERSFHVKRGHSIRRKPVPAEEDLLEPFSRRLVRSSSIVIPAPRPTLKQRLVRLLDAILCRRTPV